MPLFAASSSHYASTDYPHAPRLVLLDEAGSGTDPNEGGALAMTIIDHFRARGAMVVATTHYDSLKSYASTTDGVVSAAFGFNPENFAPTYKLLYGSPGRSLAIEIAARLGMPVFTQDERLSSHEAEARLSLGEKDWRKRKAKLDAAAAASLASSGKWGPLLVTDASDALPAELRSFLLDIKPGYLEDPTRAVYNHAWLIGDQDAM